MRAPRTRALALSCLPLLPTWGVSGDARAAQDDPRGDAGKQRQAPLSDPEWFLDYYEYDPTESAEKGDRSHDVTPEPRRSRARRAGEVRPKSSK